MRRGIGSGSGLANVSEHGVSLPFLARTVFNSGQLWQLTSPQIRFRSPSPPPLIPLAHPYLQSSSGGRLSTRCAGDSCRPLGSELAGLGAIKMAAVALARPLHRLCPSPLLLLLFALTATSAEFLSEGQVLRYNYHADVSAHDATLILDVNVSVLLLLVVSQVR